jgi:hypothetical protein
MKPQFQKVLSGSSVKYRPSNKLHDATCLTVQLQSAPLLRDAMALRLMDEGLAQLRLTFIPRSPKNINQ